MDDDSFSTGLIENASTPAVVAPAAGGPALSLMDAPAGPAAPADLDVMTFNLRHAGTGTPNSWGQRRPVMRAHSAAERPDLIGTQEGLTTRLGDLRTDSGHRDSWTTARLRGPACATIQNYQPLVPDGVRADWILTTPGVTVLAALVNAYRRGSHYPSDHLPVQARLRLP